MSPRVSSLQAGKANKRGREAGRRCSLAGRWMDAPGAFTVPSLGRHDLCCANSNQPPNYEPSRPRAAFQGWLTRLMTAGLTPTVASPAAYARVKLPKKNLHCVDGGKNSSMALRTGPWPVEFHHMGSSAAYTPSLDCRQI